MHWSGAAPLGAQWEAARPSGGDGRAAAISGITIIASGRRAQPQPCRYMMLRVRVIFDASRLASFRATTNATIRQIFSTALQAGRLRIAALLAFSSQAGHYCCTCFSFFTALARKASPQQQIILFSYEDAAEDARHGWLAIGSRARGHFYATRRFGFSASRFARLATPN